MRRLAAAILLMCLLVLAGCQTSDTELSPTPVPVEVVPQSGGDLFIAIPDTITSFDPLTAVNEDLINFLSLIYETPFTISEDGRLKDCLVESWNVNADKTRFEFRIRQDIFFSDGTPLTAEDVAASARRVLSSTIAEDPTDDNSEETLAQNSLENRYAAYNRDILSVDATSEYTVTVALFSAGNAALYFMTFPVTKADYKSNAQPIGTGPYRIDSYTEGEQAVLTINELWWQERPYIDRIVANAVTGPTETMEMLTTSILDFVTTDAINSGNYNITGQWQVIDYMTDYYDCLVPNLQQPALNRVEVRQALSDALDRRELLSTVLLNHGVPSLLPIAPDFYAVDARYRSGQSNPGEALALLGTAGYRTEAGEDAAGAVLSLRMIVPDTIDSTYKREAARAIAKQLEKVYVQVEIVELNEAEYLQALMDGDFDLAYCSYYLSEVPNLGFMFGADGTGNYGHVQDSELESAIEACRWAITEEEMLEACTILQERLASQLPQIGLYFRMNSIVCDEGIHGISDVRQNAVFATISSWYNSYFAQTIPQDPSPVAATATRHQTEPESHSINDGNGGTTPSKLRPGAESLWPASDPMPTDSQPYPQDSSTAWPTQTAGAPAATSYGPAPDPTPPWAQGD